MIRVTIWNEYRHERQRKNVADIYPAGIHSAIAEGIASERLQIRAATLDMPEHGLSEDVLDDTDVLIWWGHGAHNDVSDDVVNRVHARVLKGMGLIVLHSGHFSKIFKKLMGTSCDLKWRAEGEKERVWVVDPAHRSPKGSANISKSSTRKCTESISTFRPRTDLYSSAGSRAAKCSAAAVRTIAATGKFFTAGSRNVSDLLQQRRFARHLQRCPLGGAKARRPSQLRQGRTAGADQRRSIKRKPACPGYWGQAGFV